MIKKFLQNSYLKSLGWAVIGAIVGILASIFFRTYKSYLLSNHIDFTSLIESNITWIQLVVFLILILLCTFSYGKAEMLIRKKAEVTDDLDEERDEAEEKRQASIDTLQNTSLTCSTLILILGFTLFGIGINGASSISNGSIIIFVVSALGSVFFEIAVVNQVKRNNPMKYGDPSSLDFAKKWLSSCDEGEQYQIYQAAYKTFIVMKVVLAICSVVVLIGKLEFGTGNFPIILLAVIWLSHTISFIYYSTKYCQ